jgi:uncharacterized Zn-finger protein
MKLSKINNLEFKCPDIARQWHPSKNGTLTPGIVTPFSNRKAWWRCEKGHEWLAIINNRTKGRGCPYCSGNKVSSENNLLAVNPELAKQWHATKNGNLKPNQVTPFSPKKVWWRCEKGHEWQAKIGNRSNGKGCPYCSGRYAAEDYNFQYVNPGLSKQWHPTKNGNLKPNQVTPFSSKEVWWRCEKGHEWQSTVKSRSKSGNECPFCSKRKASKEYNLGLVYPELAKTWHPTKNGKLTPRDVLPMSEKQVYWMCERGHVWKAMIINRSRGTGCPYCSGRRATQEYNLAVVKPALINEWHPTLNGKLTPWDVTPMSERRVWWKCKKGHEWQTMVANRNGGCGCPFCSGRWASKENNLAVVNPKLAKEWHPRKNIGLTPFNVTPRSGKKVWWKCENGHEWQARISHRARGVGCPMCWIPKPNEGSFKKGQLPRKFHGFYVPIKVNREHAPYARVNLREWELKKVGKKNMKKMRTIPYSRYIYGLEKIPEGWVIWHLDGDPFNNNIENLDCISRNELMRRMRERRKLLALGLFR